MLFSKFIHFFNSREIAPYGEGMNNYLETIGYRAVRDFRIMEEIPKDKRRYFFVWYNPDKLNELERWFRESTHDLSNDFSTSFIEQNYRFDEQTTYGELRELFHLVQKRHPDEEFFFTPESLKEWRSRMWRGRDPESQHYWLYNKTNPPQINLFLQTHYGMIIPKEPFTERQIAGLDRLLDDVGLRRVEER